ncbi:putative amidohydrolase [Bradyrhizobium diazoefficiens]
MTFRVATCEFPDRTDEVSAMWRRLERELAKAPVDLLVLPELAGVDSFWGSPVFSEVVWRQAVTTHAKISDELKRLTAKRALGTRAVEVDTRRWNETFLWKPESGLVRGRPKAWLPQQEGGWEATWFDRGPQNVLPVRDDELCFAELVCTEIMVSTNPAIGLLFVIPGIEELLRVNGTARLLRSQDLLQSMSVGGKAPKLAIVVTVTEAFLHCTKALKRSRLWQDDYRLDRAKLPSLGQMISDQTMPADLSVKDIEARIEVDAKKNLY